MTLAITFPIGPRDTLATSESLFLFSHFSPVSPSPALPLCLSPALFATVTASSIFIPVIIHS